MPNHSAKSLYRPHITLATGSASERATERMLLELFHTYPLDKWFYSDTVCIKDQIIPHSHPRLTLSSAPITRDPPDTVHLLRTYIHEQLHWFLVLESVHAGLQKAITRLRQNYPTLPVGAPEGCRSDFSNYLHLLLCTLEYDALSELLDSEQALSTVASTRFYTAIYALVLRDTDSLLNTLQAFRLVPPERPTTPKVFRNVTLDLPERPARPL